MGMMQRYLEERPPTIRMGSVWRFKPGRGDPYRRLRVRYVQSTTDKTGPYVEVRSFYLDECTWPTDDDVRSNPRRQPKTIMILRSTLLKDYECITVHRHEGLQGEVLSEISSREFMP